MPNSPRISNSSFKLKRRRFNQLIALTVISTLASEFTFPAIARADEPGNSSLTTKQERYHIFIGDKLAQKGGSQAVTFKSGNIESVRIPKDALDGTELVVKHAALNGGNAVIILHTLYDPSGEIDPLIAQAIATVPLMDGTRARCQAVYQQVKAGDPVYDPQALDVLDIVVSGSPELKKATIGNFVQDRYHLASQNSRLAELQTYIEKKIDQSDLSPEEKQRLKGTYQYVRAGEALPGPDEFNDLTAIDAIVQGSTLSVPLQQRYAVASAQTRAFTADEVILNLIRTSDHVGDKKEQYLEVYHQTRLGQKVEDQYTLGSLDSLIDFSDISPECKAIYKLARNQFFNQSQQVVEADLNQYLNTGKKAARVAADVVPTLTQVFGAAGVTAGTGTAISSLTGAAATNATLAALGGGSVAAGGLGMLGGLAIATGGAALVGAAALVSVSLVAGMSGTELKNLGIAATTGTLASAVIVGTAWAAVSSFGAAGSLTGAAAITTAMATLGGASVITGGAALIAFGVGLGVWQFLKGNDALAKTLHQVEPFLYTISDATQLDKISSFAMLKNDLSQFQKDSDKIHLAPTIPIEKLSNALSNYASLRGDERILAMIDTSFWGSGKAGVVFTERGIWWKDSSPYFVEYADPEYLLKIRELPGLIADQQKQKVYELALKLGKDSALSELGTL